MDLFVLKLSGGWPDSVRLYTTQGRASAALNLIMARGNATGGVIYKVAEADLQEVTRRGKVEAQQTVGQQPLF